MGRIPRISEERRAELFTEGLQIARNARNDEGDFRFPGLLPDDHPRSIELHEKWKYMTEDIQDEFDGDGSFDMSMTDADVLDRSGIQPWRMPSWRRKQLEVVLENQEKRIETVRGNWGQLNAYSLKEATTSASDIAAYTTAALPMVRRSWPRGYIQDVVPFLAWTQPTGYYFTMDFTFASSGETYSVGDRIDNVEDPDYTDDPGESTAINEMDALIQRNDITTESLKVLSRWSLEARQDAGAYFGVNLDSELLRNQALLMTRNKQRKIVEDLRTLGTGGSASFDRTIPTTGIYSGLDPNIYKKTLFNSILDVETGIFGQVYMMASALIMDELVANYLAETEAYTQDPRGDLRGRTRVSTTPNLRGVLKSSWDTYVDPYLVGDQIIVCARGPSFLETGYTVLNYVPLFSLPLWQDPRDMTEYRSAMERFGRVMIRPEYYGTVSLWAS